MQYLKTSLQSVVSLNLASPFSSSLLLHYYLLSQCICCKMSFVFLKIKYLIRILSLSAKYHIKNAVLQINATERPQNPEINKINFMNIKILVNTKLSLILKYLINRKKKLNCDVGFHKFTQVRKQEGAKVGYVFGAGEKISLIRLLAN